MKSYNLKSQLCLFIMRWRTRDKGKSFELSSLVAVPRANQRGSDKIRLLKESSGTSLSGSVRQCGSHPSSWRVSALPLSSPGRMDLVSFEICLVNNVGFGMFMGTLSQTVNIAKCLWLVTSQLKPFLGIWEVKEGVNKKTFSIFCVQVVFNMGFNTDLRERRRILPKDPEEMELLPCQPERGASERREIADGSLCAVSSVGLA